MLADPGSIATNAAAAIADPCLKVEIQWDLVNWTDDSAYVVSANGSSQLMDPVEGALSLGSSPDSRATVTVRNDAGASYRFSQSHAGSQAATYGVYGIKLRISAGYASEYVRVFTGRIVEVTEAEAGGQATLTCHGMATAYNRQTATTTMSTEQRADEWITTLAAAAGMVLGDDYNVERGLTVVPYLFMDDDNIITEIRNMAASEAGTIHWDVNGLMRFWAATHWVGAASVATFASSKYAELRPARRFDNVWNIVNVEYTPRVIGRETKVHTLREPIYVPPNDAVVQRLQWQLPLASFTEYDLSASTAGGHDLGTVTVAPTSPDGARSWAATFTNSDTKQGMFVTRFDVFGYPLEGRPAVTYKADPLTKEGTPTARRKDIKGNFYIQTEAQAAMIANMLAARLGTVRLAARSERMRGNPLVELGDVVTLTGTNTGMNGTFVTTGIEWSFSNAYQMNLTCLDFTTWYAYTAFFKVGTSILNSARIFY